MHFEDRDSSFCLFASDTRLYVTDPKTLRCCRFGGSRSNAVVGLDPDATETAVDYEWVPLLQQQTPKKHGQPLYLQSYTEQTALRYGFPVWLGHCDLECKEV